jgi:hypothetical protein
MMIHRWFLSSIFVIFMFTFWDGVLAQIQVPDSGVRFLGSSDGAGTWFGLIVWIIEKYDKLPWVSWRVRYSAGNSVLTTVIR